MENNTISLRSLLEKEKLNGINFLDWFRNLRIVLKQERKEYVIEEAVPNDPGPNASRADKDKFKKHMDDMVDVGCLMLATMTPELQKQHENMVIRRELSDLGRTQKQQNLKERSCTEAAPNEETQNGAEKTSAEKRTSAEILGRGRKGNSIRPAIGSE
ncbi:hypothetical protein V6N13_006055 [Hibiscus sabdariffa]